MHWGALLGRARREDGVVVFAASLVPPIATAGLVLAAGAAVLLAFWPAIRAH